jgi:hypothetical protein
MEADLRDRLLQILQRKQLCLETIALAAEVIAIDARFNAAVAEKKRREKDIDIFALSGWYEAQLDTCVAELERFESTGDEQGLVTALFAARKSLRQRVTDLGGAPT